jgi:AAA domain/DnaB-like helicase N terminal domain
MLPICMVNEETLAQVPEGVRLYLRSLLRDRREVEDVGGYAYLGKLLEAAPTAANVEHYARIVLGQARRRDLNRALAYHADAVSRGMPPDEALEELGRDLETLRARRRGGGSSLREVDAADLAASPPLDLECLPLLGRRGYVVRGWSHVLAAPPKCGKTELPYPCLWDWARAGERVLYVTEEPETVWRLRLRGDSPPRGVRLVWGLGAAAGDLLRRAAGGDETVIVLDTLRSLGILGEDEADNAKVCRAITPWVAACRPAGKTLIGAHHTRKSGGEHGEGISGAHALLAAVDVALELRRSDRGENHRALSAYGRVIEPAELTYHREPDGRMVADDGGGTPRGEASCLDVILQMLPAPGLPGKTIDDLCGEGAGSRKNVSAALLPAVNQRTVLRQGSGRKGDPYTYTRAPGSVFTQTAAST